MSTSLFYHSFGILGYQYRKMEFKNAEIVMHITQKWAHTNVLCVYQKTSSGEGVSNVVFGACRQYTKSLA